MTQEQDPNAWHLDKRVPLALIVTLVGQMAFFVWWASQVDSRMAAAEITNSQQDERILALQDAANQQAVSNATLAAQMIALRGSVEDLKQAQHETNDLLRQWMQERGEK